MPQQTEQLVRQGSGVNPYRREMVSTPGADLGIGGDILSRLQSLTGMGMPQQPSALQQQTGNTFSQLLSGPTAQERAFNIALPGIQQQLSGMPGQDILGSAQPIFQRNLSEALQTQRQFGGPRFASESGRQASQLQQRSLQDYNLFAQNVMEAGRQRQLQAAGVLGGLGQGADASRLGIAQGAGQFALGGQQHQQPSAAQQQAALYKALETSVQQGDMTFDEAVTRLAQTTAEQQYRQQMQPLQPLIRQANRSQALETASQKFDPNIRSFYGTDSYRKVLESNSVLRDGINQAEADPRFAESLPQLYQMAFQLASLQSAPTATQPAQQTAPTSSNAPQTVNVNTPQPSIPEWDNPYGPQVRNPFNDAWAQVPDIQLSQVDWSKR